MKLLVDEALRSRMADELRQAGHDAVHVLDLGMQGASDPEVLARAVEEDRTVVTLDTDFGTLLALTGADRPSVLLLRGIGDSLEERKAAILRAVTRVAERLEQGAVVVVEPERLRIRALPIEGA